MSRSGCILRGLLYIGLAVLPVLIEGYKNRTAYVLVALAATYQAFLTIRAFVDTSSSDKKPAAPTQA